MISAMPDMPMPPMPMKCTGPSSKGTGRRRWIMTSRLDQFRAARNALMAFCLWTGPVTAQTPSAAPSPSAPLELRLADVGRFATFVDMGGVQWTGRAAKLRVLQVAEGGFKAGAEEFWGGWRHEVIDCDARTIAHAGF